MSVKDFLGQPIEAGCTVVYPVRRGAKMWMTVLRVTKIAQQHETKPPYLMGYNAEGRAIVVHNIQNCVVVPGIPAT